MTVDSLLFDYFVPEEMRGKRLTPRLSIHENTIGIAFYPTRYSSANGYHLPTTRVVQYHADGTTSEKTILQPGFSLRKAARKKLEQNPEISSFLD